MGRMVALLYGFVAYAFFFLVFLYAIGFTGNMFVAKTIDVGGTPGTGPQDILINVLLLGIFGLQHSIMARPEFKERWTKIVPKSVERSTYVVFSSVALVILFMYWRPMAEPVWDLAGTPWAVILNIGFWFGWLFVLASTFQLSHFELFGLAQVMARWKNRDYHGGGFKTPLFYQIVRHPIMLGFIIAFWSAPVMSQGHLLFAIVTTVYIWVALWLEERDLVALFGKEYTDYAQRVGRLLPKMKRPAPPAGMGEKKGT